MDGSVAGLTEESGGAETMLVVTLDRLLSLGKPLYSFISGNLNSPHF